MNSRRKLWVIKAGSQMVLDGGPRLISSWMKQVEILRNQFDTDVIWVTSGAIATARTAIGSTSRRLEEKQALSALGQPMVMQHYNRALAKRKLLGSQVLLTADDLAHASRRNNLTRTLSTLIKWNILPVLNENDAVSTAEIQFGDNDQLSALVARHMRADRLILLTDVDGLYSDDPKKNPDAIHIKHIATVSKKLLISLRSTAQSASKNGTGGMLSKVLAARTANRNGIVTHLVRGSLPNAILKLAHGLDSNRALPGTRIGLESRRPRR